MFGSFAFATVEYAGVFVFGEAPVTENQNPYCPKIGIYEKNNTIYTAKTTPFTKFTDRNCPL